MKKNLFAGSLMLLVMMASCSNEDLVKEQMEGVDAAAKKTPKVINVEGHELGGPLFDLETAPNGKILVANASMGIMDLQGNLEISLPGATSVSAVGMEVMWATKGPEGEGTSNIGQGLFLIQKNRVQFVANLFNFESTYDPSGDLDINSNPYAVKALSGNSALVIDSGANDLLRIDKKGNVELMAVFPMEEVSTSSIKALVGCPGSGADLCNLPSVMMAQAVPTSIAIGPDGFYYVGELKGFPAPVGESNIWKISPNAMAAQCLASPDCVRLFDGGFTSIIDLTFGDDGMLYVAEMDALSWFAVEAGLGEGGRIQVCDPETLECHIIAEGIPMLTSIVFDKEGNLWAIRNALTPDAEVVQIPL